MRTKRAFDIFLSFSGIIILSPVLFVISFLILILDGRPVFFTQDRPGQDSKIFRLIKFRTMNLDYSKEDKYRITRLGNFLRSYSLDELPELLNVLLGDMSFVGPRPLLVEYLPFYTKEQAKRHSVRPGITGWAQINGRNNLSWEEKFDLDIWYVQNAKLSLDIKILFVTIIKVLKREGISQDGEATMSKFKGNISKGKNE